MQECKKKAKRIATLIIFDMIVIKRDGTKQNYDISKIINAMSLAFSDEKVKISNRELKLIAKNVESNCYDGISVEQIQDIVEMTLMKTDHYNVAKSYILYRAKRAECRESLNLFKNYINDINIINALKEVQKQYTDQQYDLTLLYNKYKSFYKDDADHLYILIKGSTELVSAEAPNWEYVASKFLMIKINNNINEYCHKNNINDYVDKINHMTKINRYSDMIINTYSNDDLIELSNYINNDYNKLLTYSSLDLLYKRYMIKSLDGTVIESPQEMFMGMAMFLCIPESKDHRVAMVKSLYDIIASLKVTFATPTISNARTPFHQLSSCYEDVMPDDLVGIYRTISNFAQVSKYGGGMGIYIGKVRANGSDIRGHKGVAGGIIKWVKLCNDTAVSVDQLGVRLGSVAVYLDIWHRDVPEFLQIRTNNGDDRMKAHDVFPGICIPDYFWEQVRDNINGNWFMMCPHEIHTVKNYYLEDYYGLEWKNLYLDCVNDDRIPKRIIKIKDMVRMIIKSAVETGTPFIFNRDTVNYYNPNNHCGMIYCSNLCTEIAQNQSSAETISHEYYYDNLTGVIEDKTRAGDYVVCNLASLVLGNINFDDESEVEHVISTVVRAMDNVIDLNYYPIHNARITNLAMRPIGLGTSGYHHLLAKNGIKFDSDDHIKFMDKIYETINYYAIKSSAMLAQERGSYDKFNGSDWQTGRYYDIRNYNSDRWTELKSLTANGMRNGYVMAIAPTGSTSIIAGTTAGIDPIQKKFYLEEKRGSIVPRVAPELNDKTYWLYKSAHQIDQNYVIDSAGVRQRHIDQAQSVNLFVTHDYSFRQILDLYLRAWNAGVKTIYYVRGQSLEVEECESCAS